MKSNFRTLHNSLLKNYNDLLKKNIKFSCTEQALVFFTYNFYNSNRYNKDILFIPQTDLSAHLGCNKRTLLNALKTIGYTNESSIEEKTLMYYKITPKGVEIKIQ